MKTWRQGIPLAVLLGLVVLGTAVPLLVLQAHTARTRAAEIEAAERGRTVLVAQSISSSVARQIENAAQIARALGASPALTRKDYEQFEALLRNAAQAVQAGFILGHRSRGPFINTHAPFGTPVPGPRAPADYNASFASEEPTVTDLRPNRFTGAQQAGVRVPLAEDYLLTVVPLANWYSRALNEVFLPGGWLARLTDGKGRVIAASEKISGEVGTTIRLDEVVYETGTKEHTPIQGTDKSNTVVIAPVEGTDWNVVLSVPTSALQNARDVWDRAFRLSAAAAFLLALGVGLSFSLLIRGAASKLARAAQEVGSGRVPAVSPTIMSEANQVADALRVAAMEIHKREGHLRVVMQELAHRSKNLLAVISAMARQSQRTAGSLEDFIQSFGQRLTGLSRSHDLLTSTEWTGADIAELATSQITPFLSRPDQLELVGDYMLLTPSAVQNLGLAFHELATNAAKYGALSVSEGLVRISWSASNGSDTSETFEVTWEEKPVTPPPSSHSRGFGRVVLEKIVPAALNGAADWSVGSDYLKWQLRAPASAAIRTDMSLNRKQSAVPATA